MRKLSVNGGRVVELPGAEGPAVVDDEAAALREQGVPVEPRPRPAGSTQERDELGRWM